MSRNESSRAGASGSHSGYSRSYRAQFSVLGPLHSGFGFAPEKIKEHALSVAQKRNQDAELNRKRVSKVPLQVDSAPAPTSTLPSRFDAFRAPNTVPLHTAEQKGAKPSEPLPVVDLTKGSRSDFARLSLSRKRSHADRIHVSATDQTGAQQNELQLGQFRGVSTASARNAMGQKPTRFGVMLGVFVDSALCFAVLAIANFWVQELAWAVKWQAPVRAWLAEAWVAVSRVAEWLPFTALNIQSDGAMRLVQNGPGLQTLHWLIVLLLWALTVFAMQFLCLFWLKSSFGRWLAGIAVNPVASRRTGQFAVPFFELLTFGGLFIFPLMLTKTDRHIFLGSLRFHVSPRAPQVKRD